MQENFHDVQPSQTSPFAYLIGNEPPLPSSAVVPAKKRGRPKKHHPDDGKLHHRMDDGKPARELLTFDPQLLVNWFRLYRAKYDSRRSAVTAAAEHFDVPYPQAYALLESEE